MAARWTTPDTASPTYKAMKIYRNYDGNKSTFGDVSVKTTSTSNPDSLSVFGAQRSGDNAVTVMVINKVAVSTPVTVNLSNFAPAGIAQVYQLTSANTITRLSDITVPASSVALTVPGAEHHAAGRAGLGRPGEPAARRPLPRRRRPAARPRSPSPSAPRAPPIRTDRLPATSGRLATARPGRGRRRARSIRPQARFTATLTVTDNQGATGTATVAITVVAGSRAAGRADEPVGIGRQPHGHRALDRQLVERKRLLRRARA